MKQRGKKEVREERRRTAVLLENEGSFRGKERKIWKRRKREKERVEGRKKGKDKGGYEDSKERKIKRIEA